MIPEEVKGTTTSFSKLSEFWPPPAHGGGEPQRFSNPVQGVGSERNESGAVTKPPPSYNDCPYGCTPINSAVRSVPGTVLSVVAPETNSRRLIHQALNGTLKQRLAAPGANLGANPGYLTPLATLSWDGGNQVGTPHISGAPPDGDVDRSACTTLIETSSSETIASQTAAGRLESSLMNLIILRRPLVPALLPLYSQTRPALESMFTIRLSTRVSNVHLGSLSINEPPRRDSGAYHQTIDFRWCLLAQREIGYRRLSRGYEPLSCCILLRWPRPHPCILSSQRSISEGPPLH